MRFNSILPQLGSEVIREEVFCVRRVVLVKWLDNALVISVIVGGVQSEPAELGTLGDLVGDGEHFGEDTCGRSEVVCPSEPSTVPCINVERDVRELEFGNGVCNGVLICVNCTNTLGSASFRVSVGDEVGLWCC
jgi:hypothetical protein